MIDATNTSDITILGRCFNGRTAAGSPKRHGFLGPNPQEGLMQTSSLAEMNLLQLGRKFGNRMLETLGNTTIKGIKLSKIL